MTLDELKKVIQLSYKGQELEDAMAALTVYASIIEIDSTNNQVNKSSLSSIGQDHNSISPVGLIVAKNALDSDTRDIMKAQENKLRSGFQEIELRIIEATIDKVEKNYLEEQSDIISKSDKENFENEVSALLVVFYASLYMVLARQLLAHRASEFGVVSTYEMTTQIQKNIQIMANKTAISHVNTVLNDILDTSHKAYEAYVLKSLEDLVSDAVKEGRPSILAKLPDNPTPEQISSVVRSGAFDNTALYKAAEKLARQGEGQTAIVRSIRNDYQNIANTRATTIARTESARVFNQSQYEADKQFLTNSGLMNKAYKKLRSRTGTPCVHCEMLINQPPIPFEKNFADLGDSLKATITKDDGTVRVSTLPVNWMAIDAGNVHPNCNCEYVLIIKD